MKKIKAFFRKLREWWKIPRARSIMILCFYALFFTAVFLYIDAMRPSSPGTKMDFWTSYETMDNYDYQMVIIEKGSTYHLSGTRFGKQDQFQVEETKERYQVEDHTIKGLPGTAELSERFSFSLLSLRPDRLGAILKNQKPTAEVIYQDGSKRQEYLLPSFEGLPSVTVTVRSKNDRIEELSLRDALHVTITYQNIGAIRSLQPFI